MRWPSGSTYTDVTTPGRVASPDGTSSVTRSAGLALGLGRLALGAAFLARPVDSVRLLGTDTATANRMAWLARMAAVRDAALGAGAAASLAGRRTSAGWLLAGALADAGDAVVLAVAARDGRLDRQRAYLVAGAAAITAVVGAGVAGARLGRRPVAASG